MITNNKSIARHKHTLKLIKFLNNNVKINTNKYDLYADIAGNKDFIELLSIGDSVYKILDYPIRANDDKRVGSTFRSSNNIR